MKKPAHESAKAEPSAAQNIPAALPLSQAARQNLTLSTSSTSTTLTTDLRGFMSKLTDNEYRSVSAAEQKLQQTMFSPSEATRTSAMLAPDIRHLLPASGSLRFWQMWLVDMNAVQDEDKSFFFDIIMGVLVDDILDTTGVDFTQYVSQEHIAEHENHLRLLKTNRAYAEKWLERARQMQILPVTSRRELDMFPHDLREQIIRDLGDRAGDLFDQDPDTDHTDH